MREFKRTRYGCDFCKKIGGRKSSMVKHEAGCTNNPNRVCAMHQFAAPDDEAPTVAALMTALREGGWPALIKASHNCPACKLAAYRQSTSMPEPGEPWPFEPQDGRQEFNFKDEVAAMWKDIRAEERQSHAYY